MINEAIKIYGSKFFPIKEYSLAVVPIPDGNNKDVINGSKKKSVDFTFHPHYHDFSELVIIYSGCGVQNISGTDYPVSAGDVFLLQGNTTHYFSQSNNLKLFNILFHPDSLLLPHEHFQKIHGYNVIFRAEPKMRSSRNFKSQLHLTPEQLACAESMVWKIQRELIRQEVGFQAVSTAILIELITFVCRNYEYNPCNRHSSIPQISLILTKLENDVCADWNLSKLARIANTSERHLVRLFRKATGTSPINYLLTLRLRRAAKYLEQDNLNVSEIAELCGFNDSNYFSKKFKERYKVSPLQYRKQ